MNTLFSATAIRGVRSWIAIYALIAVALPSTGSLPWLLVDTHHESRVATGVAAQHAAPHDRRGASTGEAIDAADIPGSPTHPLDHDCAECKVLKHLARCVPGCAIAPELALLAGTAVRAPTQIPLAVASITEERPPIRGPPPAIA